MAHHYRGCKVADTSGASHDGPCAGLSGGHDYRPFGSGRWIRTTDLVVMSHASCRTALPRKQEGR